MRPNQRSISRRAHIRPTCRTLGPDQRESVQSSQTVTPACVRAEWASEGGEPATRSARPDRCRGCWHHEDGSAGPRRACEGALASRGSARDQTTFARASRGGEPAALPRRPPQRVSSTRSADGGAVGGRRRGSLRGGEHADVDVVRAVCRRWRTRSGSAWRAGADPSLGNSSPGNAGCREGCEHAVRCRRPARTRTMPT